MFKCFWQKIGMTLSMCKCRSSKLNILLLKCQIPRQIEIYAFKKSCCIVWHLFQAICSGLLSHFYPNTSLLPLQPHGLYCGCLSSICFPINLASFPTSWSTSMAKANLRKNHTEIISCSYGDHSVRFSASQQLSSSFDFTAQQL